VECIRYALSTLGLPPVSPEEACRTIGLSLHETFRALTGQTTGAGAFERLFVERAETAMVRGTVILRPARGAIRRLRDRGVTLGIVSTKFRRRIDEILVREGLAEAFDVIVGGEDVQAPKPDPEGLRQAMARLGTERVLYVGDSTVDARTAAGAGVPFIAVCTGTTPRATFDQYGSRAVLDDLTQLQTTVASDRTRRSQC
jgi:phosphoglycolate phosphatase